MKLVESLNDRGICILKKIAKKKIELKSDMSTLWSCMISKAR